MLEMTILLTIMSVDTALVVVSTTTVLGVMLFSLLFSAIVRLMFIERLVGFVQTYPAVRVFFLVLLVMIGSELIVQGLGLAANQMGESLVDKKPGATHQRLLFEVSPEKELITYGIGVPLLQMRYLKRPRDGRR